jgi:Putative transposase
VLSLPIPLRLLLAANLNIHLHCLVLDGVYRRSAGGEPQFVQVAAPPDEAVQAVLHQIITRMMKLLTLKSCARR